MKGIQELYDADGYKQKLDELEEYKEQVLAEKAIEAEEKEKKIRSEKLRLNKIFNETRCGKENMHFVKSLIDRASFLRIELEYIEESLRKDGCLDFFTQGSQAMWREHPLSKVHVQYIKNYKDVITKLESYGKSEGGSTQSTQNSVIGLINRGESARGKYKE